MNAVIYARVSSKEQQKGYSLEAQIEICQNAADRDGVKIDRIFQEAESASKQGRCGFAEMLEYIEKNKGALVYVEKVDRLHRNYGDMAIISVLVPAGACEIRFARDGFRLHQDSPPGDWLNFGINSVIADNYARNLSREVKKGHKKRFEAGRKVSGNPVVGYKIDPSNRQILIDEEKAPLVKRLFELAATGCFSLVQLQGHALEWGLVHNTAKNLASSLHRMLHNPFYYGWLVSETYGEKVGAHEPIISKRLWDEVQEAISRKCKAQGKRRRHLFEFTGVLKCECGETIVGDIKKGRYVYYNCRKRCYPNTRESDLEDQFEQALAKLAVPRELFEIAVEELESERGSHAQAQEQAIADVKRQIGALETKIAKLVDEKISGNLDEESYRIGIQPRAASSFEALKIHKGDLEKREAAGFFRG